MLQVRDMNRTTFFLLLVLLLLTPFIALSEEQDSPVKALESIISNLQYEKHPRSLIDVIHFETAYSEMANEKLPGIEFSDAQDMKDKYALMLENPEAFVDQLFSEGFEQLKNGSHNLDMDMIAKRKALFVDRFQAMLDIQIDTIKRSTFTVADTSIYDQKASLALMRDLDGNITKWIVFMILDNGKWFLTSPDFKWLLQR